MTLASPLQLPSARSLGTVLLFSFLTAGAQVSAQAPDRVEPQDRPTTSPPAASPEKEEAAQKVLQSESGRLGKTEPIAEAIAAQEPSAVLVNGKLAVPGAPEDSQTVPSKFSDRNAAIDQLPIMGQPLKLSDEQKRQIWKHVSKDEVARLTLNPQPAQQLPPTVEIRDFGSDTIPAIESYRYVRLANTVLLVDPLHRVVVGEVKIPKEQ
jgi:hypothetical protein